MAKESVEADLKKTPSTLAADTSSKSFYKKSSKRQESNTIPSKVLVRRLPPAMTKECFLEEVSPLPDHNYLWFVEADKSLGLYAFSRAYINFVNQEDIFIFTEKFDGYIFVDKKGDEYSAIVEFAPFQKIPKAARKKDAKIGTIETDPDFLKFVENQENMLANKTPPTSTAETLEEITSRERELKANKGVLKMSTPLLDYLRKRKEDKNRLREEKKEERRKKDADRRKQREDDRKKQKDHKRPGDKPTKPEKPTKVLSGKHTGEKKPSEEELSSNLMTVLKITENKEQGELSSEVQPASKKPYPHKEGKAENKDIKKREFKRKEKKPASGSAAGEEKGPKADTHHEKKAPQKPKPAHPPKEPKSYKEERQKIQEARAARAAAKLESKSGAGEKDEAGGGEESKSGKPTQRVRNKDRPALQIYRPGMLKRSTSDSKGDDAPASDDSKGKADE